MNTNRKEIARFREIGLLERIGRELIKRGIVFEYIYTGGNIYLIQIGDRDGKHLWIDEDGFGTYYPDIDQQDFITTNKGHKCPYEQEFCVCWEDEISNLITQIGIGAEIAVRHFKIPQVIDETRQREYGLAVC